MESFLTGCAALVMGCFVVLMIGFTAVTLKLIVDAWSK